MISKYVRMLMNREVSLPDKEFMQKANKQVKNSTG